MRGKIFFVFLFMLFSVSDLIFGFPNPGNDNDSLILLVVRNDAAVSIPRSTKLIIRGMEANPISLGKNKWTVKYLKLSSGTCSVSISDRKYNKWFTVSPASITLLDFRVNSKVKSDGSVLTYFEDVNEEDRQRAAKDLPLYIGFSSWVGREFKGFGSLRPTLQVSETLHRLSINSEPVDSEVFLDDVFIGKTPIKLMLDNGKHQIMIKKEGYHEDIRYVSLQRSAEINSVLEKSADREKDKNLKYRTLVVPFLKSDGSKSDIADLLGDTLIPVLKDDSRLEVLKGNINWTKYGDLLQPDFSSPELKDIDLIATGIYVEGKDKLTVEANLYDVRTESVRAGITWEGPLNVDIFDALDEISLLFRDAVNKVLPDAGKILIRKKHVVYSGMSTFDSRIERKLIIKRRWERKHTVTLISGILADFVGVDVVSDDNTSSTRMFLSADGPRFPLTIDYEQYISRYLSFGFCVETSFPHSGLFYDMNDLPPYSPGVVSVLPSVRGVIRGIRSDLFLGLGPSLRYIQGADVSWQEDGSDSIQHGYVDPIFIIGLQIQSEFRIYVNSRIDDIPKFIMFGLSVGMPEMSINLGTYDTSFDSIQVGIYIGVGVSF